ncbi:MAG: hypothetical protein K1000chlam3_01162 [Chlamydiae bacterium]|nr:hypothetical protein [Chlamydiota bacterium]
MSVTTITATAVEAPTAESRRDRMKRAALEGIEVIIPKVKEILHSGANAIETNADQCGELAADSVECLLQGKDTREGLADTAREPVSACTTETITCAVQSSCPYIDPAVNRVANCTGKVAEKSIDCAANSANACTQGTSDLKDRGFFSCASN